MKKYLLLRYASIIACCFFVGHNASANCCAPCNISIVDTTVNIACGDSFSFGGTAYKYSITQTDTFTSVHGCDSIVTLHLKVTDTVNIVGGLCAGDSILFYGTWIHTPGQHDTLIPGINTCDSLVILNLAVSDPLPPTYVSDTICQGDSLLFNGVYIDTAGVYNGHFSSNTGCDSLVTLTLTIRPAPVVTFTWDSLVAEGDVFLPYGIDTAAWCGGYRSPNMFVLKGGSPPGGHYSGFEVSNDTFYADQAGRFYDYDTITYSYADNGRCTQSANGVIILTTCEGVPEINDQYSLQLYPNPAIDYLTIEYNAFTDNSTIEVLDMLGRVIKAEPVKGGITKTEIDTHALSNELYFLRVIEGGVAKEEAKFSIIR